MNRSKIEWCDYSWNPITGCRYDCRYCYVRKKSRRFSGDIRRNLNSPQCKRDGSLYILENQFVTENGGTPSYPFGFEPTLHRYRLEYLDKLKNGANILVGESGDTFGDWIPDEWIRLVIDECMNHRQHNYLFLTKNPERYWDLEEKGILPAEKNMWYGCSYSDNTSQSWGSRYNDKHNFICVEPLLEDLGLFNENCYPVAEWVIIGAETGNGKGKITPKKEWIEKILVHCDKYGIPVFMKDSLIPVMGEKDMRREFPESLLENEKSEKVKARLEDDCCRCGIHLRKNKMIALSARSKRGEQPKQFTYMCKNCFRKFCEENGVEIPRLEELNVEEKELPQDD